MSSRDRIAELGAGVPGGFDESARNTIIRKRQEAAQQAAKGEAIAAGSHAYRELPYRTQLTDPRTQQQAAQLAESRQQQQRGLSNLQRWATGQDSVVDQQTARARSQLGQAMASQVATGGFDPRAARSAAYGMAQGQADLGAQAAIARQQEQLGATQAWLAGVQGMRGQDMGEIAADRQYSLGANAQELAAIQAAIAAEQSQRKIDLGLATAEAEARAASESSGLFGGGGFLGLGIG